MDSIVDKLILASATGAYRALQALGLPASVIAWRNPLKLREYVAITSKMNIMSSSRILDFGCGTGLQAQNIARLCGQVVGIDTSSDTIERARKLLRGSRLRKKIEFVCSDLISAKLPDAYFDIIVSFCVLEHVHNLDAVLLELRRITKPGGWLHVSVDCLGTISDAAILEKHRIDHHVVRYFTPMSVREHLCNAGWHVAEVEPILRGDVSRQYFQSMVRNWPRAGRIGNPFNACRLYRAIEREDATTSESQTGLMLVVRAMRP